MITVKNTQEFINRFVHFMEATKSLSKAGIPLDTYETKDLLQEFLGQFDIPQVKPQPIGYIVSRKGNNYPMTLEKTTIFRSESTGQLAMNVEIEAVHRSGYEILPVYL